jgi:hypothetical protein
MCQINQLTRRANLGGAQVPRRTWGRSAHPAARVAHNDGSELLGAAKHAAGHLARRIDRIGRGAQCRRVIEDAEGSVVRAESPPRATCERGLLVDWT